MGDVVPFPPRRKQNHITSLGPFQSEEGIDYTRILSEYKMIKGPNERIVVHVPISNIPPDENECHAIMTVYTHLVGTYRGRFFLPVRHETIDGNHVYIIEEC